MEPMTQSQIDQLLCDERIGRLCMADTDGRPYAIPLPFTWIDGCIYLRLPMTGRKGAILAQNRQVCFEVDTYTQTLDDYASVVVEGTLQNVTELSEKSRIRAESERKYLRLRQGHRPGHGRSTPLEQLALQKIIVEQIAGRMKEGECATAVAG